MTGTYGSSATSATQHRPTAIPTWLQHHLESRGYWNTDGISRHVRTRHCTCHTLILVGLDADRCAGTAIADPTPLSPLGEAAALILGRATYALRWTLGRLELDIRDSFAIRGHPAGTARYDVVADHECGTRPLPSLPTVHGIDTAARVDDATDPPY